MKPDDMMITDKDNTTASDALQQLNEALKELVGPSGLAILPQRDQAKEPREADLHPLSKVPLARTRRKLFAALDALKKATQARESWEDDKTDRLLKVKQDAFIRSRAVKKSKAALAECRRMAITTDPFAGRATQALQWLRAIAEEMGATLAEEKTPGDDGKQDVQLSIIGSTFLSDFHFIDVMGNVVKVNVKFRYLMANNEEAGDPAVDASFAALCESENFEGLRDAFKALFDLETLAKSIGGVSLVEALRCFEDDLLAAQEFERKSGAADEARMGMGHGIVSRSAQGLSIKFMKGHSAILSVEDAIPSREISIARSQLIMRPDEMDGSLPVFEYTETGTAKVDAQYVLRFNEPISVFLSVAQSLQRVGGGEDMARDMRPSMVKASNSGQEMFNSRGEVRIEDNSTKKPCWPSLQKLLAPQVFRATEGKGGDTSVKKDGETIRAREVVKERIHWSLQSSEFIAAASLPDGQYLEFSHSGTDVVSGLSVHRVPLCHPRQVKPIFALVRQQIVFNELFRSCFGFPVPVEDGMAGLLSQPVELVIGDSPSFIHFSFYYDAIDDMLAMAVNITLGGEVSVTLKTTNGRSLACSDAKATAILRVCRSIPLTILTISKMGAGPVQQPG